MIKIYHNPRCSKSREGLQLLQESGKDFQIVKYLDIPMKKEEIKKVLELLEISAEELVRKNEKVWKENYKGKELSEDEIISAMQEHPKLIERPIVVKDKKAVIGRPPEKIKDLI
ncbi:MULTISPECIES: arsenate reductase (glutaredoxin) [Mesonia]|uniref:Arsenate reductase n=1 Tax=Mesonia oceanica TaxID=2687242 RepID=A0AC61Y743_9FLAO|nr:MULTISPECIES: arsenate reductase (glutaredoxin) [Mesonia]MAN26777.1 arsenate reductase (glutaredoxin) [Mesonia sp.]MAQ40480.1 arsenate reductase (glutaredoxin) [Mesonia sp.]MBJ98102.1 arsenate reductase (glutaredoxin) [Flavobacteriaceae bacterium]VVV00319.1 Arsenate reductase [Mesonia oceanica]|tara:strand:+ start:5981 stop:6322 length:342 start_codon:yes stop_codon:yes gene_type:complete